MNMLTWFLYLADVLGNFSIVLHLAYIFYFVFGAVTYIVMSLSAAGELYEAEINKAKKARIEFFSKYARPRNIVIAIMIMLVANLMPSTKTMYLMAASEIGEEVVMSEYTKNLYEKIDKFLETQLSDM